MKKLYVFSEELRRFVEVDRRPEPLPRVHIQCNSEPIYNHIDGKYYGSSRSMEKENEARGFFCMGNDKPSPRKDVDVGPVEDYEKFVKKVSDDLGMV